MKLKALFDAPPFEAMHRIYAAEDFAMGAEGEKPNFDPKWAKVIGTSDGREVWGSRCFGDKIDVFAFRTGEVCDAFIALRTKQQNNASPLVRIWCDPNKRNNGLVTALLGFVTKKLNNRILITKTEPLTKDGIEWLVKLVNTPRGFSVTDGAGVDIKSADLITAWKSAEIYRSKNEYQVFIENNRDHALWGEHYPLLELSQHLGDENLD